MKPTEIFDLGFTGLVSVIPPTAPIAPTSRIRPEQRGKVPGRKVSQGWAGYDWLDHTATREDVERWERDGANIGLKAGYFPALDIDTHDDGLAEIVQACAERTLGAAPVRIGKHPKRLMPYRLAPGAEAFARLAVTIIDDKGIEHLIEFLGAGRQYLVYGDHPSGRPYTWRTPLPAWSLLTPITLTDVQNFFTTLGDEMAAFGYTVRRSGDGAIGAMTHSTADLRAPTIEALRECVALIPNTDALFDSRDSYIKMGEAIHAASEGNEAEGEDIFSEWASRWTGADGRTNSPDTVREDWRRLYHPHRVGWGWLTSLAIPFGFSAGVHEFDAVEPAVGTAAVEPDRGGVGEGAPRYSDAWLADTVIEEDGDVIRYVPGSDRWYVYRGGRWEPDGILHAEHLIDTVLRREAALLVRSGATDKEKKAALTQALSLCSAHRASEVRRKMKPDPRIATAEGAFDADPWLLNTPGGVIDLQTMQTREHNRDLLCSRQTTVAPADTATPLWEKFLLETCGGDLDLVDYLRRWAGYALTGRTTEHVLGFAWGSGGNGKSVFLNTLAGVMGDYHESAPMDTFTASGYDRHPTDLASLAGARLVTAVETQAGRRWDEQRIKALTGGDAVKARFMRQDFFTYTPQYKLLFAGNHQPEIRNLDDGIRRRVHLIPFTRTPRNVDRELFTKLKAEWPGILNWMLVGCAEWQLRGLEQPPAVREATEAYFAQEDPVAQWLLERCETDGAEATAELFRDWEEWANARGEYVGSMKRLSQLIAAKHYPRWRESGTRRNGFSGMRLRPKQLEVL